MSNDQEIGGGNGKSSGIDSVRTVTFFSIVDPTVEQFFKYAENISGQVDAANIVGLHLKFDDGQEIKLSAKQFKRLLFMLKENKIKVEEWTE